MKIGLTMWGSEEKIGLTCKCNSIEKSCDVWGGCGVVSWFISRGKSWQSNCCTAICTHVVALVSIYFIQKKRTGCGIKLDITLCRKLALLRRAAKIKSVVDYIFNTRKLVRICFKPDGESPKIVEFNSVGNPMVRKLC